VSFLRPGHGAGPVFSPIVAFQDFEERLFFFLFPKEDTPPLSSFPRQIQEDFFPSEEFLGVRFHVGIDTVDRSSRGGS